MDNVLLDTNIVIDYIDAKRPCHGDAATLLEQLLESPSIDPVILTSSIKDAYYILCRRYGAEQAVRSRLQALCDIIQPSDVAWAALQAAFSSDEPDLEDGIVRAAAELSRCTAIITRDAEAFARSPIPALDARGFLARFMDEL